MKINKIITAAVAVLVIPAISSAIVIGDFEGGSMDGWIATAGRTTAFTTTGATLNSDALSVTDADGGWETSIELDLLTHADTTEILSLVAQAGSAVQLDVTAIGAEVPDGWLQLGLLVNADSSWLQEEWNDVTLGATTTLTYEFTEAGRAAILSGEANETWSWIGFIGNGGGAGNTYYVDNIQVIPEPATLGLFGAFGVGILFVRRHFRV